MSEFNSSIFSIAEMTEAINLLPGFEGRLASLFKPKPIKTRIARLEFQEGKLALIPASVPGSDAPKAQGRTRTSILVDVPHFQVEDKITAADVEGVRAFGTNNLETIASVLNDKQADLRLKHDWTHEYLRVGALGGRIMNPYGDEMYNLFTLFGVQEKVIDLQLGTATTDVLEKMSEIVSHMEKNMFGESFTGKAMIEMAPDLYARVIKHQSVRKIFEGWQANGDRFANEHRKTGFSLRDVTFREYVNQDGDAPFIAEGVGHAYPLGTTNTFQTFIAPATFLDTVNLLGQPIYARSVPDKWNTSLELHAQSNVLPICNRPRVLVKVISSN